MFPTVCEATRPHPSRFLVTSLTCCFRRPRIHREGYFFFLNPSFTSSSSPKRPTRFYQARSCDGSTWSHGGVPGPRVRAEMLRKLRSNDRSEGCDQNHCNQLMACDWRYRSHEERHPKSRLLVKGPSLLRTTLVKSVFKSQSSLYKALANSSGFVVNNWNIETWTSSSDWTSTRFVKDL